MVVPLAPTRSIPAEILTTSHFLFGQIKISNIGTMGLLSDPRTSYVEVGEASIARVQTPDTVVNYAPLLYMVKSKIVVLCLNKREYAGSQTILRGGYSQVFQYPIQITTTVYELKGTLEWAGRFDFAAIMGEGTTPFLVIHDAVLVSTLFPKLRLERTTMCFNRGYLDSLIVSKKES